MKHKHNHTDTCIYTDPHLHSHTHRHSHTSFMYVYVPLSKFYVKFERNSKISLNTWMKKENQCKFGKTIGLAICNGV